MHLTNYSINKKSSDYERNTDAEKVLGVRVGGRSRGKGRGRLRVGALLPLQHTRGLAQPIDDARMALVAVVLLAVLLTASTRDHAGRVGLG